VLRLSIVLLLLATLGSMASATEPAKKPNIIVILSDDMGFSDLGCYGGEIKTPNLDALAANGLRFTQFYNTARCCPTRASLLTGLYPHQAGVGHMMDNTGKPGYTGNLNKECRTIAEMLKPAGYRNYALGKWHVTQHTGAAGPKHNWPMSRGFDRYYGTIHGAGSFYDPSSLVRDNRMISAFDDSEYQPKQYYYTDAISDHAVRFVNEHSKDHGEKPFFMYVAYTAAHWPMHALPEDIAKYKGKYDAGYEPIRQARFDRAVKLGLIDPKQPMSANPENWDRIPNKQWEAAGMEVYAAMVDRMDQGIGKIVSELKRTGQLDNTLILYMQDNGACAELQGRTGNKNHPNIPRPDKPTFAPLKPSDLITTGSVPAQTRDGFPVRMGPNVMPGPADTYIAYGRGWASVSNTPFREYKHWVHEGGISTPLVASWPKGISEVGTLRTQPGHLIDIAATCVDLAGATYPQDATPLEGKTLRNAFVNKPMGRDTLFWEHEGNRAVRVGDWKLVAKHGQPWELFDISKDRVEANNLAKAQPDRVKELVAKYEAYAKRAKVEPWPVQRPKK
jgi:arylsulfatase A-like enzyme